MSAFRRMVIEGAIVLNQVIAGVLGGTLLLLSSPHSYPISDPVALVSAGAVYVACSLLAGWAGEGVHDLIFRGDNGAN